MAETPYLLANLVLAIGAAVVSVFLALRLRQSVILGYLVAGVLIGPYSPGFVGDIAVVQQLADIGVILLMFSVGLGISFRNLLRAGAAALVGANVQVIAAIGAGYAVGMWMGWSPVDAVFLGAVVSNSSSTVITKVLGDRDELDSPYGHLALAWSSVQDLGTVLLVVLLTSLAAGGGDLSVDIALSLARAGAFLAIAALGGTLLLPRMFERLAELRSRELFVLSVTLVALGTALASTLFGLSLALGAFVAGVVVAESDLSYQILGEVAPMRDVFAGLFFVSVGMLVDPLVISLQPQAVLLTLGLIVVVKGLLSASIPLLFGYSARAALLSGVALAQSAEFSVVLARLGADLGAVSDANFAAMMGGVVLSIALSPLLYGAASSLSRGLFGRLVGVALTEMPDSLTPTGGLRGHAILCGYGRVGRIVAGALRRKGLPFVVIDEEPRLVQRLRERGVAALLGNPANPILLRRAGLDRARVLVVAVPDAVAARQIVDRVRRTNPDLDIVVRTHSWTERDFHLSRGVAEVVMGELELALEITRHVMHRFGIGTLEVRSLVQGLRQTVESDPHAEILPGEFK